MDQHSKPIAIFVPLSKIRTGYNPRRYFDERKHEELVVSIRLRGVLQPLLVRPCPENQGDYLVVAGGRRLRAATEAFGPDGEVPVFIRDLTDDEALDAAIDENDIRDDASETEQADAAVRVMAACKNDRAEAARRLGWSKSKLDRRLALANLAETVKVALDERRIKLGHAELLAAIPSEKQETALTTILGSNLDVSKTRELLMKVTQSLASAQFDRSECTTCPFNSATQRALFETHVDDGHCTNPGCFQLKTEAVRTVEDEFRAEADGPEINETTADDQDDSDLHEEARIESSAAAEASRSPSTTSSAPAADATSRPSEPNKVAVTIASLANRTSEVREATWRTALARMLAGDPEKANTAILVAAMSGTLSHIRASTLTTRAKILIGPEFPHLSFSESIAAIRDLQQASADIVLSSIAAAYAKDVSSFSHVADLARAFEVDIREVWTVDQAFLDRYTKDELKFIASECGFIAHYGQRAFAKLLASKKADLITAMLNATGFDWAGRLPSAMTLDGSYGAPTIGQKANDPKVAVDDIAA